MRSCISLAKSRWLTALALLRSWVERLLLTRPRAIVADGNVDRASELAHVVQAVGFDPVVKSNGRDVLRRLHEAADIDTVIVDAGIPESPLPYLLAQLRADVNFGLLPVIIVAPTDYAGVVPEELERGLNRFVQGYRNVWVVSRTFDQNFWKQTLAARVNEAQGSPLTKEERVANAKLAMQWLRRLAVGEVPGFDIRPGGAGDTQGASIHRPGKRSHSDGRATPRSARRGGAGGGGLEQPHAGASGRGRRRARQAHSAARSRAAGRTGPRNRSTLSGHNGCQSSREPCSLARQLPTERADNRHPPATLRPHRTSAKTRASREIA